VVSCAPSLHAAALSGLDGRSAGFRHGLFSRAEIRWAYRPHECSTIAVVEPLIRRGVVYRFGVVHTAPSRSFIVFLPGSDLALTRCGFLTGQPFFAIHALASADARAGLPTVVLLSHRIARGGVIFHGCVVPFSVTALVVSLPRYPSCSRRPAAFFTVSANVSR
jgi:hypothetical protein